MWIFLKRPWQPYLGQAEYLRRIGIDKADPASNDVSIVNKDDVPVHRTLFLPVAPQQFVERQ